MAEEAAACAFSERSRDKVAAEALPPILQSVPWVECEHFQLGLTDLLSRHAQSAFSVCR